MPAARITSIAGMGVSTDEVATIVRAAPSDEAVLGALRSTWDEARVRRWSDRFTSTYRTFILMWDIDEGYVRPTALQALALAFYRPFEGVTMEVVRRVRRAP
jgi:hypothetical protein